MISILRPAGHITRFYSAVAHGIEQNKQDIYFGTND